jgi:hypothetical protein
MDTADRRYREHLVVPTRDHDGDNVVTDVDVITSRLASLLP